MEPWRGQLLAQLRAYAARPLDAGEAAMLAEYEPFIIAHPDCLWRTCRPGHLTASVWIVDAARQRTLLTHHRQLDRWLQLGGHVDGESDLLAAALREAREESGSRACGRSRRRSSTWTGTRFPSARPSRRTGTTTCVS